MKAVRYQCGRQDGMALVVVLWIIVLLSVIATGHSKNAHLTTKLTSHQIEQASLRAAGKSALRIAILDLLAEGESEPWPLDGRERELEIMETRARVGVRSATGLLDLNLASQDMLTALVEHAGAEPDQARALVDAILDWRDADDLKRLNGAEEADYRAGRLDYSPRNGAFVAIDELRYVAGMSQAIFEEIAPLVTVHSGQGGVALEYAPPRLVEALVGEVMETTPADLPTRNTRRAGVFHIRVESLSKDGKSRATLEAVVSLRPSDERPYEILQWHEPMREHPRGNS